MLTPAQLDGIGRRVALFGGSPSRAALAALALDVPALLADVVVLRDRLALLRAEHADLLAHARAAVAAARDGEADPAGYVRDVLAKRGQLPPGDMRPPQLLAAVRGIPALAEVVAP